MNAFKLDLHNALFYDEVELDESMQRCSIGNVAGCDVRFRKDAFAVPVMLTLEQLGGNWEMRCNEEVYLSVDSPRKLTSVPLAHGMSGSVKYGSSNADALSFSFSLDFRKSSKSFDRVVALEGRAPILIGGSEGCDIRTTSAYTAGDAVEVAPSGSGFAISVRRSAYGVSIDGVPFAGSAAVEDGVFLELADTMFYLKGDGVHFSSADEVDVSGLTVIEDSDNCPSPEYPKFARNTRLRATKPDGKISVLDPPTKPQKPKTNIVVSILPAFAMIIVCVAMRYLMPEGSAYILLSAAMMGIGLITSFITFFSTRRQYKKDVARRDKTYRTYIDDKQREIQEKRDDERAVLNDIYPNLDECLNRAATFSPRLFDVAPGDFDFLEVRLGKGSADSLRAVDYKKKDRIEDDDELVELPEKLAADYKKIDGVPIVIPFGASNAIGVIGDAACVRLMACNLALGLSLRHFRSDALLAFALDAEAANEMAWVRLLPHANNANENLPRLVSFDAESQTTLFELLYQMLSERDEDGENPPLPRVIVFVFDSAGFLRHPVSRFVASARDRGVCFVFVCPGKDTAPLHCDYLVEMHDETHGVLLKADDKNVSTPFECENVTAQRALETARLLAPVFVDEVSLQAGLRKSLSMFEMLGIYSADDLDLSKRWSESDVCRSMEAPIGVNATDDIVYLDLHEKAHGPHGLVAGTTGSGKSELLQTYILSVSTLFHPYEVAFLIIDFKGGGMANQFRDLPHLVGAITNIDGHEIERSLKSIRAELLRRQELFAQADVNHIDQYIGLFKSGAVGDPLPHLVIIVDEFAELKAEQPEFMAELISASRIGRSLGVHLILATQKPSGQVSEQIWSNSRFKLCLKVQSREDSNEMIRSPLAAEIVEPGRAYLQVGNNEIFELVQSGYSGASSEIEADGRATSGFVINRVDLAGRKTPIYERSAKRSEADAPTQLDALVAYLRAYCTQKKIEPLRPICLPSLPDHIDFPDGGEAAGAAGLAQAICGVLDDPDRQRQDAAVIDLQARNVLVVGSSQMGKTNLVQALVRSLVQKNGPDECVFYIMDFASLALKSFEPLVHVGGVVIPSDEEAYKNLMRLLVAQLNARRDRFLGVGASSYSAYREAGYGDYPQIVVIIENMAALRELYLQEEDDLYPLLREGPAFGMSFVATSANTSGLSYRYMACFDERICLYNNDSSEYANVIDGCRARLDSVPGRMLVVEEKRVLEGQVFLAFEGERDVDRVSAMAAFVAEANEAYRDRKRAMPIPAVPEVLNRRVLEDDFGAADGAGCFYLGLDYDLVEPVPIDAADFGLWGISGRHAETGTMFIKHLVAWGKGLLGGISIYAFDGHERNLAWLRESPDIEAYSLSVDDATTALFEIEDELTLRSNRYLGDDDYDLSEEPFLLVLVDNEDVISAIDGNAPLRNAYENIVGRYKRLNVGMVLTSVANSTVAFNAPQPLRDVRDTGTLLFSDDVKNAKVFDAPFDVRREYSMRFAPGDALLVREGEIARMKVADA